MLLTDLLHLSPLLIVAGCGLVCLLIGAFVRQGSKAYLAWMSAAAYAVAGVATWWLWRRGEVALQTPFLSDMFLVGPFGLFWTALALGCGALVVVMSADHLGENDCDHGEYYSLVSFALVGMLVMAMARHVFVLIVGLEIMSLSAYVLTGFKRQSPRAVESALKYFVLGAFSSAILLYGMALLYGATGLFDLEALGQYFVAHPPESAVSLPYVAALLLLVGFSFKIAAVPFHMWTPDVYEGALSPITGFMATAVKAASFAAFIRVFFVAFDAPGFRALPLPPHSAIAILATLSMFVGNLSALSQHNVKRMLAYSSIAHAGYLLVGLVGPERFAGNGLAFTVPGSGTFYYLFAYALANLGAFAVVALLAKNGQENADLEQFAGLGKRHPVLAAGLTVCLLSLAGVPPLAGFYAKYRVFSDALAADGGKWLWLVIVGVVNSAIAAYYYLRVTLYMYFREPAGEPAPLLRSPATAAVVAIATVLSLHAGLQPTRYERAARRAAVATTSAAAKTELGRLLHAPAAPEPDAAAAGSAPAAKP